MAKNLFVVETKKSDKLNLSISNDWRSLKNKFSGERLFKYSYFNLISGNFSSLENSNNRWFLDKILEECSKGDNCLLPAIKKIVSDTSLDEGIRQRASGIQENAETVSFRSPKIKTSDPGDEENRLHEAKTILAGIRSPQTAQILRLLKDKSPELQRTGIFMIGKFRIYTLLQDLCEYLNIHDLEEDTFSVLRTFRDEANEELYKCYFKYSGNINTCKNILRLLGLNGSAEIDSFCFERLWSTPRSLRELALEYLAGRNYLAQGEEKERLPDLISEVAGILTWLLSAKICLREAQKMYLTEAVNKEYERWEHFLAGLTAITDLSDDKTLNRKHLKTPDAYDISSVSRMTSILFGEKNRSLKNYGRRSDPGEKKLLKKLQHFFPGEIPLLEELIEDVINCDYNILSIWTKACFLRDIKEISTENLADSVVALLFSPEEILQEEAASLIARSDQKFYRSVFQRIPEKTKIRLDRIISGESEERELLFEKTIFLSSLFPDIREDELVSLAENMKYLRNTGSGFPGTEKRSIIWILSKDKSEPEVIILNNGPGEYNIEVPHDDAPGFYVLKLEAVETFHSQFPERSFGIIRYIDDNEK
ncbi:MAG: hypothetical protein JXN62_04340 [Bacteroidales bacterium]|nr:hypothetical protein [Bacteroidales bacterium]